MIISKFPINIHNTFIERITDITWHITLLIFTSKILQGTADCQDGATAAKPGIGRPCHPRAALLVATHLGVKNA